VLGQKAAKVLRPVSPAQQEMRTSDGIIHNVRAIFLQAAGVAVMKSWTPQGDSGHGPQVTSAAGGNHGF
jgi:hypothetical protein